MAKNVADYCVDEQIKKVNKIKFLKFQSFNCKLNLFQTLLRDIEAIPTIAHQLKIKVAVETNRKSGREGMYRHIYKINEIK